MDLRKIIDADKEEFDIILEKFPHMLLDVIYYQKNLVIASKVNRFTYEDCKQIIEELEIKYHTDKVKYKIDNITRIKNSKLINEIKEKILKYKIK